MTAINFIPLRENEFQDFIKLSHHGFATELARARSLPFEKAFDIASDQIQAFLPEGFSSPNNYFYHITNDDQKICGTVWLYIKGTSPDLSLFIADLIIDPSCRGTGVGKLTMQAIEEKAKELNCSTITLHVFSHNEVALKLYQSSGYEETSRSMRKVLNQSPI